MAEYIDKEQLLDFIQMIPIDLGYREIEDVKQFVKEIPAADVVEVVRCKDCIYFPSGDDNGENRGFSLEWPHDDWPEDNPCPCKCDDGWYSIKPTQEFYCAYGKRG